MPSAIVAEARDLLVAYTYCIDEGRLADWPGFFRDPGLYRITTRRNEERGYPLSIMLCDNHKMLFDRVEAIEKANVFEPHLYRHILSDSRVLSVDDAEARIETSFMCVRTMVDGGAMTLFAAGRYVDHVVCEGGKLLYQSKVVVLDSSKVDTLLALPL
jgi:anthranilate 1,2-dioxygenase small subunit